MERRIKKIKLTKEGKIHITYEQANSQGTWDEYSMTCSDRAKPSFYDAIDKLREEVRQICELPGGWDDKLTIRGISISWALDVMGATITALMKLLKSSAPLVLNTPHKTEEFYSEQGDPDSLLSGDCVEVLHKVFKECEAYIDGEREQGGLFQGSGIESVTFTHGDRTVELRA
jgi:hypothetical protein